jgi:TatD DNase family protein
VPEFIDTHAHTNFDAFDPDRDAVYARAREAGVVAIVEVGVGLEGSRRAVARAAGVPLLRAAAGLHPTGLDTFEEDWPAFEELVTRNDVAAVGECGLDYHWMKSPRELQERAFRLQIDLARRRSLPFIVHCREAEADLIRILRDEGYPRGVVHCFGGTREEAEEILHLGLHLSFCGNVTYPKAGALRDAARAVPLDRLMLETDAPFLPPQAKRGQRNEPAFVALTARFLADLHGAPLEELARRTTRNARRFFQILEAPGTIAYRVGNGLYVNLTRLCTAHCYFCPREGPDRIAFGHDLALARDPGTAEILAAVGDPRPFDEVVYCGLGEPLLRLDRLLESARALRAKGARRIRVNTNGHGNLIHRRDVTPDLAGVVDSISISLNYHDAELYERHCPSVFGLDAWPAILDFARRCKAHVPEVTLTVVAGAVDCDVERCRRLAAEAGTGFRARPLDDLKAPSRDDAALA